MRFMETLELMTPSQVSTLGPGETSPKFPRSFVQIVSPLGESSEQQFLFPSHYDEGVFWKRINVFSLCPYHVC